MATFYVTFGQNHPLRQHWVEVVADDKEVARTEVFHVFGPKFSMFYDSESFKPEFFPAGKVGETLFA